VRLESLLDNILKTPPPKVECGKFESKNNNHYSSGDDDSKGDDNEKDKPKIVKLDRDFLIPEVQIQSYYREEDE